jgi:hypothetical protein
MPLVISSSCGEIPDDHNRVYTVGEDDQYAGVKVIECDTDDAALERAKHLLDRRAVDIWEGGRVVARVDPPSPKPPER